MGQLTNMGVGLGAMAGMSGAVGGMVGNVVNDVMQVAAEPLTHTVSPADEMVVFKAKVEKLSIMKDAGLITDEELAALKAELLKSI